MSDIKDGISARSFLVVGLKSVRLLPAPVVDKYHQMAGNSDKSSSMPEKGTPAEFSYEPSTQDVQLTDASQFEYLKHYFTSKEGWIGDYVAKSPFHFQAGF
jgi:hypothetical protein